MISTIVHSHFTPFAGQDIRSLIVARALGRANHPFLLWEPFEGETRSWTYREFAARVAGVAAGLHERGVRPGDRVLVHLDNCPESIFVWFGCAWMGAVAVTTNANSSVDELRYFVEHSGAVGTITQPKFAESVGAVCKGWIAITQTDNGREAGANAPAADESFERLNGDPANIPARGHDPLAPFAIQYTSGTTSRPKAVLWTHANALWGARINALHEDLRPDDVHHVTLPLFHTNAQAYSVLATLWAGGSCVIQPRFSASRFWPVALKHRCTWASLVPFCVRALADQPVPERHSFRLWGSVVCEPPSDAHFRVKTIGWWGMTETITHGILGSTVLSNRPLSIGRPAPEYQIKILHENGSAILPGETGKLWIKGIRGLSLFAEYCDNPAATERAFDGEGYFDTGDLITLAEDGALIFSDRAKDMLKVGGENVAASEIERVILSVPGVREVAVVAKKHPLYDEVPVAFVLPSLQDGLLPAPFADDIITACRRQLAKFKVPHEVRVVESLPRSTIEKVAKVELRKLLEQS